MRNPELACDWCGDEVANDDRVMTEMIDEMNWEMLLRAFGMEVDDVSR